MENEELVVVEEEAPNAAALLERIANAEKLLEEKGGIDFTKYGFGAWSPSKVKMLTKCQYQFYLKYVLKVKPDDDYVQDTSMADVGTVAHRILEHVVLGRSITDAYRLTKQEHCQVPVEIWKPGVANLSGDQWDNSIIPLETNIVEFQTKLERFARNHKIKRVLTELRLGVTKDWHKTTFFAKDVYFRGIIDLVMEIDLGSEYHPDAILIDHKHGGAEGDQRASTRNYSEQLNTYKPLYHFGQNKISGMTTGIHFIKAGKTAYDDYTDAEDIETKVVKAIEWTIQGAIDGLKENGFFKHVRGNQCKYCEFDEQCKAKMLKDNELGTKKWFAIKKV